MEGFRKGCGVKMKSGRKTTEGAKLDIIMSQDSGLFIFFTSSVQK